MGHSGVKPGIEFTSSLQMSRANLEKVTHGVGGACVKDLFQITNRATFRIGFLFPGKLT